MKRIQVRQGLTKIMHAEGLLQILGNFGERHTKEAQDLILYLIKKLLFRTTNDNSPHLRFGRRYVIISGYAGFAMRVMK